ncbi:MAG: AraC family transcriptional regulator [Flavisolibacter sp.]|nr:AraC family transcriptional regulator [Flavisolibacter sp.]
MYDIIPELQPYVKVISSVENPAGSAAPCTFRVFPDTCVEVFFGYNNSTIANINAKAPFDSSKSFVTSRLSRYMDVQLPPGSSSIAVCFHPGAAFPFFHLPMKELTDDSILLVDLWGEKTNKLEDTLSCCNNHRERVSAIQTFLWGFIYQEPPNNDLFKFCLLQINKFKGQMPLKLLSKKINISQRQLSRQFNSFLGLAPKEFSRITRFLSSLYYIKKYPSYSLTQIAYESGYFDQAHFIHDCREFTGFTPKELITSKDVIF